MINLRAGNPKYGHGNIKHRETKSDITPPQEFTEARSGTNCGSGAMVGSPPQKKFLGRSTTSGGRSGVDFVRSWTGAGSGVDSVNSWNGAGSGVDSVSSWNGAGSGVDSESS